VTPQNIINKLVIIIVASIQSSQLMHQLTQNGYYFTLIDSSGGFLQESTVCLLIGLNQDRLITLLDIIRKYCATHRQYIPARGDVSQMQGQPLMIEAQVGGATVYALDVDVFYQC
jgi:uncharacterized protein YaaQ